MAMANRTVTTEQARKALSDLLSDKWSLCVPPQPTDPDLVLDALITERDTLAQALADAETRAALLTRALYDEVRHPINARGGVWMDEEIRYYLSAKWGLTIEIETRAAWDAERLAALAEWEAARQVRIAPQVTWLASHSEADSWHLSDTTDLEDHLRHRVEKLLDAQRADAGQGVG